MKPVIISLSALCLAGLACTAPLPGRPQPTPPPTRPPATAAVITPTQPAGADQPALSPAPDPSTAFAPWVEQIDAARMMADVAALAAIPSRHVNSATVGQATDLIAESFVAAGAEVNRQSFPLTYDGISTQQVNVIGEIAGRDPALPVVVVGAHYDSRTTIPTDAGSPAPGANDNASGTALLIELARVLSADPPQRTVLLVAFSAEEINRGGSDAYLAMLQGESVEVYAMLNLDTLGNAGGTDFDPSIRLFAGPPAEGQFDSPGRWLARSLAFAGEQAVPGFDVAVQPTLDRPNRWGDHFAFDAAGIPAARLIEAVEDLNRNHSSADTPFILSEPYFGRAGQVALAMTLAMAEGPPPPADLTLTGDTLHWNPVPAAGGYLVALRDPNDLELTRVIAVGNVIALDGVSGAGWVSVAALNEDGIPGLFSAEIEITP